jgi:L-alanine-DL-glutamate epimerase-like enolase superfamily enzyme
MVRCTKSESHQGSQIRVIDIRERTVPISRYADPGMPSGGLNTTMVAMLEDHGWSRAACQPHGGHLFSLHIAAALRPGGSEANPHNFQPFGGFADGAVVADGCVYPPEAPGIGFETRSQLYKVFRALLEGI